MPLVLAGVLLPVIAYCLVRTLAPARTRAGHGRDIDAGHVLMGAAMVAMVGGHLTGRSAAVVVGGSALVVVWSVALLARRTAVAAHLRLTVGAAAMVVMTLPLAGPAQAAGSDAGMAGMSGMSSHPPILMLALTLSLAVVAAARLPAVVRRGAGASHRLDAGCDVVMAGAMAAMLLGLV